MVELLMSIRKGSLPQSDKNVIRAIHRIRVLILFAVLFVLSGCGGGGGGSADNTSLTANAGADQTVNEQTIVTLDGTGSKGKIASYTWDQIGGPPVSLNNGDTAIANYVAPALTAPTVLRFRLSVSDNNGANSSDEVTNSVIPVNVPPTADAGPDRFDPEQTVVILDGSQSSDSDGTIVSYTWRQISGPDVNNLINADTATPSFTAPAATDRLTFELTVTDNEGGTDIDTVTVSVAEILFSDEFSNGDQNGWTTNIVDDSGNISDWRVIGGEYFQQNYVESISSGNPFDQSYHLGTYSYLDIGATWIDFRFTVEMTPLVDGGGFPEGNDAGVIFRYQDPDNYYRLSFNSRYGFRRLEKKYMGMFSTLAVDALGYDEGEKLSITIEIEGPVIHVFVNNDPVFSVVDNDIASGTIAFYCQDLVKFDNVMVTENSLAPAVLISTPNAYSIATTDTDTFVVSANANHVPAGGSVEFVLDDDDIGKKIKYSAPYVDFFTNVSRGEHVVDAILRDSSGSELARDTNVQIGVRGDYYVAVGDSITNGVGDENPLDNKSQDGRINAIQGYEAGLNDLLTSTLSYPHIVFNEGIGGDKSLDALTRIDSILDRHPGSNKILILLGTNDSSSVDPGDFGVRMQLLVDAVQAAGKEAWVALIPPVFNPDGTLNAIRDQRINGYNAVITTQLNGPLLRFGPDLYTFFLNKFSTHFSDEIHPNGLGYEAMADEWHDVLILP